MAQQDVYTVTWVFNHPLGDGDLTFSIDYRLSSVITARTEIEYCSDLAQELVPYTETDYVVGIPSSFTFTNLVVKNRTQPLYEATEFSGEVGGLAVAAISLRSAPIVRKVTGLAGRSYRGRFFAMAPAEADQEDGQLTAGFRAFLRSFAQDMIQVKPLNDNVYNATVWSEVLQLDNLLTDFTVRPLCGSVRNRQKN